MNCLTWQKFQGAWLGSVIATLMQKQNGRQGVENWLLVRRLIAVQALKKARLDTESLAKLEKLLFLAGENNVEHALKLNRLSLVKQQKLVKHKDILLSALPLMIFSGKNQKLLQESLDDLNLEFLITAEEQEDILIWFNLLDLCLNQKFKPQDRDLKQIIKQVLNNVNEEKTLLPQNLEIVINGWDEGLSLYQLTEKLNNEAGSQSQKAIALSVYCFAFTPQHFELAVKRATNASLPMVWLTTILTATLSGAYNGVSAIPISWRLSVNRQQIYQSELQIAAQIFKVWLGVSSPANSFDSYNHKLDAVALANSIQTRKALKIISQKNH